MCTEEKPALRRAQSALAGHVTTNQTSRSGGVHSRSACHRAHRSYSHTQHEPGYPSYYSTYSTPQRKRTYEYDPPTRSLPPRPASAQLVRSRGAAATSSVQEPLPVPTLDLRRLDQAVSLAQDAANAADENEARWQSRPRARSRPSNTPTPAYSGARWNNGAFASSQSVPNFLGDEDGLEFYLSSSDALDNDLHDARSELPPVFDDDIPATTLGSSVGSDASGATGAGPVTNVRSRIGRFLSLPRISAAGAATLLRNYTYGAAAPTEAELVAREEAERRHDAELTLDLYISSLGYLLSALPPKEAIGVSEKHRAEMRATLREALNKFEASDQVDSAVAAFNASGSSGEPSAEAATMQSELAALRQDLQNALASVTQPQPGVVINNSNASAAVGSSWNNDYGNGSPHPHVVHHIHTHTVAPGMQPTIDRTGQVVSDGLISSTNRIEDLPSSDGKSSLPSHVSSDAPQPGWRRRAISSVTWGTVDAGLALSAGAVNLVSRAVSSVAAKLGGTDTSPAVESEASSDGPEVDELLGQETPTPTLATPLPQPSVQEQASNKAQQNLTQSQWVMAIQVVSSAVQALTAAESPPKSQPVAEPDTPIFGIRSEPADPVYESDALVAREVPAKSAPEAVPMARPWPVSAVVSAVSTASSVGGWVAQRARFFSRVDHSQLNGAALEEQVIRVAADLGRAVKRSALPNQIGQLIARLGRLLQALDQQYTLREKTTKLALKNVAAALRLARTYQLHVFAARAMAASVEAVIAAIEAYRDERAPAQAAVPPPQAAISTIRAAAALLAQAPAWQPPPPSSSPAPAVAAAPGKLHRQRSNHL